MNNLCLGIDFGTTNSCLSIWYNNKSIIIQDIDGSNVIPTVIEISNNSKTIGKTAYIRKEFIEKNKFTVYEIKRLVGRKFSEMDESLLNTIGYDIYTNENDDILIFDSNENRYYHIEEILTHLFMSFKSKSENFVLEKVIMKDEFTINNCVISVPVNFNKIQRETIKNCAISAGFNVLRLINEPTAAALSYGLGSSIKKELNILIYDLGGGTLDVSVLNINNEIYEVLGTCGNDMLGGSDFDRMIMEYCLSEFIEKNKLNKDDFFKDISNNSIQLLKYSCEQAKIALSDHLTTRIFITKFYNDKNLLVNFTRTKLMEICNSLISLMVKPIHKVLENCELKKEEIDEIVMVGGMTRMPIIRLSVETFFGKDVNCSIDPDKVVSVGASIHGFMISNKTSIQNKLLLVDRTSLSIGLETAGGVMDILIPRGTIIPVQKIKKYTTDKDFVESILIKIYEGERRFTRDNFIIGDFKVTIDKEKRGVPRIQITFEIDMDGIIKIKAEDINNPLNKNTIQLTDKQKKLSDEELKQIIDNANIMDQNDKIEFIKKKSHLELIDNCKRILENLYEMKIDNFLPTTEHREKIITDINEILKWLMTTNYLEIDVEKYIEMKKTFATNYSILLISCDKPQIDVKCENDDSKTDSVNNGITNTVSNSTNNGVDIYDENNVSKFYEQLEYFKTIINEYSTIKKQIEYYKNLKHNKLNIVNKINEIMLLFDEVCKSADNASVQFYMSKILTNEDVETFMNDVFTKDSLFKTEFSQIYDEINIFEKLKFAVSKKECELLELIEDNNDDDNNNLMNENDDNNNNLMNENGDNNLTNDSDYDNNNLINDSDYNNNNLINNNLTNDGDDNNNLTNKSNDSNNNLTNESNDGNNNLTNKSNDSNNNLTDKSNDSNNNLTNERNDSNNNLTNESNNSNNNLTDESNENNNLTKKEKILKLLDELLIYQEKVYEITNGYNKIEFTFEDITNMIECINNLSIKNYKQIKKQKKIEITDHLKLEQIKPITNTRFDWANG